MTPYGANNDGDQRSKGALTPEGQKIQSRLDGVLKKNQFVLCVRESVSILFVGGKGEGIKKYKWVATT